MNIISTVEELYPFDSLVEDLAIVGYSAMSDTQLMTLRDKAYSVIYRFVGLQVDELTNTDDIQSYKDTLFDIVRYTLVTSSKEENDKFINESLETVMYLKNAELSKVDSNFVTYRPYPYFR